MHLNNNLTERMQPYPISNEESKRINFLKFISIIFVVFIHSVSTENINFADSPLIREIPTWLRFFQNMVVYGFASMAVPMFFLISAILLFAKEEKFILLLKKKSRTVLLPYIVWNTLWIILFLLFQNISITKIFFGNSENLIKDWGLNDFLSAYGIGLTFPYPILYPLWFMRDLMIMIIISPIIRLITKRAPVISAIIASVAFFQPYAFPFKTAIVFFFYGAAIVQLNLRFNSINSIPLKVLMPGYIVIIILKTITNNPYVSSAAIIIGIVFWIKVSYVISAFEKNKILSEMTKYTIFIYFLHEMSTTFLKKISARIFPDPSSLYILLEFLLIPGLVILGCFLVGKFIHDRFTRLSKLITGNR